MRLGFTPTVTKTGEVSTPDPIIAQIQLGIHLRDLRLIADLNIVDVAKHLDCSGAKISKVENGKQGISADEVAILLELYKADDTAVADALRLAAVPRPRRRRGSRSAYREAVPQFARRYVALEADASDIATYENEFITGLLQTEDYARTLLRAGAPFGGDPEIEAKVDTRMLRQQILTRTDPAPVHLDVILNEACLHRFIGDEPCMRGQLEHLVKVSTWDHVRLQILPFRPRPTPNRDEAFVAQTGFIILRLPERGSLLYIEDLVGGTYPEDLSIIDQYVRAFERLRAAALSPDDSRKLIAMLSEQL
jgi:transcriptional regulator with XRE-family HTH domain